MNWGYEGLVTVWGFVEVGVTAPNALGTDEKESNEGFVMNTWEE